MKLRTRESREHVLTLTARPCVRCLLSAGRSSVDLFTTLSSLTAAHVPGETVRIFSIFSLFLTSYYPTERFALRQTSILSRVSSYSISPHPSPISPTVGYPGIPPGAPDRPQAAVKGVSFSPHRFIFPSEPMISDQAIEVRLGPQGVKAKYVRVELRKIETIPGLPPNSYYDFVGQSPVNLWRSSEEYSMLHSVRPLMTALLSPYLSSRSFLSARYSFLHSNTRVHSPDSHARKWRYVYHTTHSRSPDRWHPQAGIKYELVGQVCIRSKSYVSPLDVVTTCLYSHFVSGFFRRNKPIILSSSTPIIIDKHELHSTWPVFQQHESRHLTQDAVTLTVDRSQNCYGPGDRVLVHATIRSDSPQPTILRGFEFTLKETTIFRAGPHVSGRSGGPQIKINIVGEQKVLVNMTMQSGQVHRSELAAAVPQTHTTTTLNSARHIDITYVLIVKALMGSGKPLIMELPVIVSNWPR